MTIGQLLTAGFTQLGYKEVPNNKTKYGKWYGLDGQPWCMIFQQWLFNICNGSKLIKRTASCGSLWKWAKSKNMLVPISESNPGDLVIYSFKKDETSHVGHVVGFNKTKTYIYSTEGNTSGTATGSQDNGEGVYFKKRPVTKVYGKMVIRPKYDNAPIKIVQNDREITVWSAPAKLDDCRERTIKPQTIQVYDELIPSFTKEGDMFYRTIKNRFVLAKYCK